MKKSILLIVIPKLFFVAGGGERFLRKYLP